MEWPLLVEGFTLYDSFVIQSNDIVTENQLPRSETFDIWPKLFHAGDASRPENEGIRQMVSTLSAKDVRLI